MNDIDKTDSKIILELLKEMRDDHKELAKISNKHREETLLWQSETSNRLSTIEVDLRDHKEGVINNRGLLTKADERMKELERPYIVVNGAVNFVIKAGKVIVAIGIIAGIFKIFY